MRYYRILILILCGCAARSQNPGPYPAPVFVSKEKTRVHLDSVYRYQFTAIDSGGNPIYYDVSVLPSWLAYSKADRSIVGKPLRVGQYSVRVIASNRKSTTSQNFMITVFDNQTVNILPIGNSITNGTDIYNSYRRALWRKLHKGNFNFDFIGSWSKHHMGGEVPNPDFDLDHEGHSGWTYEHLFNPPDWDVKRGNIRQWVQYYTPDLVLIELGTNDVFQCRSPDEMIKNLSSLVTLLRSKNSDVKIFVGSIIPLGPKWIDQNLCGRTYKELLHEANERIVDFVRQNATQRSPLILVDQYSAINPRQHLYDDIHPNALGEEVMAENGLRPSEVI